MSAALVAVVLLGWTAGVESLWLVNAPGNIRQLANGLCWSSNGNFGDPITQEVCDNDPDGLQVFRILELNGQNSYRSIVHEYSGICVQAQGDYDGALLHLAWAACDGGTGQSFYWDRTMIRSLIGYSTAVDTPGGSLDAGVAIAFWTSNEGTAQQWEFFSYELVQIESKYSGMCLTAAGGQGDVWQDPCIGADNQLWYLGYPATSGAYGADGAGRHIISYAHGEPLDQYSPYENGQEINTWHYTESAYNQRFYSKEDMLATKPSGSEFCLSLNSLSAGSSAYGWDCTWGADQFWRFVAYEPADFVPEVGSAVLTMGPCHVPQPCDGCSDGPAIKGAWQLMDVTDSATSTRYYAMIYGTGHDTNQGETVSISRGRFDCPNVLTGLTGIIAMDYAGGDCGWRRDGHDGHVGPGDNVSNRGFNNCGIRKIRKRANNEDRYRNGTSAENLITKLHLPLYDVCENYYWQFLELSSCTLTNVAQGQPITFAT